MKPPEGLDSLRDLVDTQKKHLQLTSSTKSFLWTWAVGSLANGSSLSLTHTRLFIYAQFQQFEVVLENIPIFQ